MFILYKIVVTLVSIIARKNRDCHWGVVIVLQQHFHKKLTWMCSQPKVVSSFFYPSCIANLAVESIELPNKLEHEHVTFPALLYQIQFMLVLYAYMVKALHHITIFLTATWTNFKARLKLPCHSLSEVKGFRLIKFLPISVWEYFFCQIYGFMFCQTHGGNQGQKNICNRELEYLATQLKILGTLDLHKLQLILHSYVHAKSER